jgi:uncharacterized protein YqeY
MTISKTDLQNDLTAAIREKNSLVTATLRMVLAAITNEEVAGKVARELSDQELIQVLTREAKKRKEAATAYEEAKRTDLADKERAELEVIAKYLPAALSDHEIAEIIAAAVATVSAQGASGPAAMGQVMKIVQPQVAGRADGSVVANLVKAALAN